MAGGKSGSVSLAERAYREIMGGIQSGSLPPGSRLRFADLQALCGTSVTPIREALSRLASEGFAILEENRGYRVSPLSITELWDITRSRQHLETHALRLSIERGGDAWEETLVAAHHMMSRLSRGRADQPTVVDEEWNRRHANFHAALIGGCGSPIILSFCEALFWRADLYRRITIALPNRRNVSEEHRRMFEMALFRRSDEACQALRDHYELTAHSIEEFFRGSR